MHTGDPSIREGWSYEHLGTPFADEPPGGPASRADGEADPGDAGRPDGCELDTRGAVVGAAPGRGLLGRPGRGHGRGAGGGEAGHPWGRRRRLPVARRVSEARSRRRSRLRCTPPRGRSWTSTSGGRCVPGLACASPIRTSTATSCSTSTPSTAGGRRTSRNVGHPRDPFHRIDVLPSSRRVRLELEGEVLAESGRPLLLFETMLPTRFYLRREDVRVELIPSATRTTCAYKGRVVPLASGRRSGGGGPRLDLPATAAGGRGGRGAGRLLRRTSRPGAGRRTAGAASHAVVGAHP